MKIEQTEAIEILKKYNQNHIIEHMGKLNSEKKEKLAKQVQELDFEEIIRLYNKAKTKREKREVKIEPLETICAKQIEKRQKEEYIEAGEKILQQNKYAVVTLAGGQGTRLRA